MHGMLDLHGGTVTVIGSPLHARFLNHMTEMFCSKNNIKLIRSWAFFDAHEQFTVKFVSTEDWDDFKEYLNDLGIVINLKHKTINMNKIWWPSTIEIIFSDDNEYLVWMKMVEY